MKQWQSVLLGVFVGLIASALILLVITPPRGEPIELVSQTTPANITVFITGAVKNPGIYSLPYNSRAVDAVDAAGGMVANADNTAINLAARLKDSDKLLIPFMATPVPERMEVISSEIPTESRPTPSPERPLNINTALADELDLLPGIGPSKAGAIVAYREKHGDFKRKEDIQNVSGIGPAIFEQIKELITIEPVP
jgi:competence protein ComEA